jgi:D-alanyl-D-alanine carboxypeptidase
LPASWGAITLRQLLQHTSGLPNYTATEAFGRSLQNRPHRYLSPRQLIGFVDDQPPRFEPGSRFAYSNTDNIVVGLMIEEATASSFEGQLGAQVLGPLGLRRTSLPSTALMPPPSIRGYDPRPEGRYADVSEIFSASGAWASGAIVSTPAE